MGLLADQNGILRRYIQEGSNWDEHLTNTRQSIIEFIKEKNAKTISILGSAWLLDIPIHYLAEEMDKVFFYDIRHPRGIIDKYGKYPNFRFVEMDLTGGLVGKVYDLCHRKSRTLNEELLDELLLAEIFFEEEPGFVVSVNTLNQLDILLIDYLKKNFNLSAESILHFRKKIQENHLKMLRPSRSCLITDVEEIHVNDDNEETDCIPLVFCQLPGNASEKEWIWHFDTLKTYHSEYKTYMKVKSMYI